MQAFAKALELHKGKYDGAPDSKMLSANIAEARREAKA